MLTKQGEETSEFTNTLGEKIKVQICATKEETSELLCRVLDGRKNAADLLAKEVHSPVPPWDNIGKDSTYTSSMTKDVERLLLEDLAVVPNEQENDFTAQDFAIWIDPIGKIKMTV